ncbi:MAG: tripartite tricarboxylate transporter substrate-binding protein, partial [Pseudolabrys sp.]
MSKNLGLLTFFASLLISGSSGAQDTSTPAAPHYPEHSVRMVVGFTAGGPTDVIARIIAEKLSTSLGQQFYVDNRPGAGGNIASAEVAKAAPDGYTIIVVSTGFMVNMSLYVHVPYDAVKDFAPITMVAYSSNVLLVNPSMPAKSVKELIELIKANPNKYSFAGPGIGSTPHLSGELFKQKFGLDMVHVPFPGAAQAISSAIAGHTPIAFTALPPALSNIQDGKLHALAVLAVKRNAEIPNVPTMLEAGYPD